MKIVTYAKWKTRSKWKANLKEKCLYNGCWDNGLLFHYNNNSELWWALLNLITYKWYQLQMDHFSFFQYLYTFIPNFLLYVRHKSDAWYYLDVAVPWVMSSLRIVVDIGEWYGLLHPRVPGNFHDVRLIFSSQITWILSANWSWLIFMLPVNIFSYFFWS